MPPLTMSLSGMLAYVGVHVPAQCLFEDVRMTLLHTGPHSSAGLDSAATTSRDSLIVRRSCMK